MLKYFKRKSDSVSSDEKNEKHAKLDTGLLVSERNDEAGKPSLEINHAEVHTDPGLRPSILDFDANVQDQVRREYVKNGPCQPKKHKFPLRQFGKKRRKFNPKWFKKFPNWLEYSISKDAAYCLCCYLFRPCNGKQSGGNSFTTKGFSRWSNIEKLQTHVGGPDSAHNKAWEKFEAMKNEIQNVERVISRKTKACNEYRTRLTASVNCVRLLLKRDIPFLGHDETEESSNQRNFLELLELLADYNDEFKNARQQNADENLKLTSPEIQKAIVNAAAYVTIDAIICDLGKALFSIIIGESSDVSMKKQMSVVLRYVDKRGNVVERLIGIDPVTSINALSLKEAIDKLFARHGLKISRLRGQSYEGASDMQGELNGLKNLVAAENPCAFYVHCFCHQLQSTQVYVAKNHSQIASFFSVVHRLLRVVGASPLRCDVLEDMQAALVNQALKNGESFMIALNQQTSSKHYRDTSWGPYDGTVYSLISIFSSIVGVLKIIADDGLDSERRGEANNLLDLIQSFDFVFCLHLMSKVLRVSGDLASTLQRKDIKNAMTLVRICKLRLQSARENEWDSLFDKVSIFCQEHNIKIPNMDGIFRAEDRSRCKAQEVTNLHQFRENLFCSVLEMQIQELNDRFTEVNTELLMCIACLSPDDSFAAFDKNKLIKLAKYYPEDFSEVELIHLDHQLDTYIIDMRSSVDFKCLEGLSALARKMVETKRNVVYELVYLLITLALILPVDTATEERVCSAVNVVKNRLSSRTGEQWVNDSLIVHIEKETFDGIDNESIIQHIQIMESRFSPVKDEKTHQ